MAEVTGPAVFISGLTAGTFSTLQRDVATGRIFSTRFSPEAALVPVPGTGKVFTVTSPPPEIGVGQIFQFVLDSFSFPRNVVCIPAGVAAGATGTVEIRAGAQPARLVARVRGLGLLPPGTVLNVWLIHDLVVPPTLDPADLAALPRALAGVNQPGQVFTADGQPSTVGRPDVPFFNTVSVPVRAGTMTVQPDGTALLEVPLTDEVNMAVDPRVLLGVPGVPPTATMPSGIVAAILTDVFMRPVTVAPDVPLANFALRLLTVVQAALARFDRNGDGFITADEGAGIPGAFLEPQQFHRVVITVDPATLGGAPIPSDQAVVLAGQRVN